MAKYSLNELSSIIFRTTLPAVVATMVQQERQGLIIKPDSAAPVVSPPLPSRSSSVVFVASKTTTLKTRVPEERG